ncbi:MAG: dTDP-4-dehydrorhamnose reductase [Myxococcales bacterium]|nr:dTDP-4-dehydrorhamnose reductase [Myxococcales bacterium]
MTAQWIVTGCRGQLGRALTSLLESRGIAPLAVSHAELDIADAGAVGAFFAERVSGGGTMLNAAAFTHVDRCEREPEMAERCNAIAPEILAHACRATGTRLVHLSTDYVFSGEAREPYREDAGTGPCNVYGRTKLEGERRVLGASPDFLVVRSSWIFGAGRNFIAAILDQAERRRSGQASGPLRVVDDQTGRPTYARDLAQALLALLEADARGLYHVANAGIATWWDLARFCLDETGYAELSIERIRTEALGLPARRPRWSVLDCSRAEALGVRMRGWKEAVRAHLHASDGPAAHAASSREVTERASGPRPQRATSEQGGERES